MTCVFCHDAPTEPDREFCQECQRLIDLLALGILEAFKAKAHAAAEQDAA